MKHINFSKLSHCVVDELLIYSLDHCLYTVRVVMNGEYFSVRRRLKPYQVFAIGHVYRDFSHIDIKKITVIQDSAYDEMVGQPIREASNRLSLSAPVKQDIFQKSPTQH